MCIRDRGILRRLLGGTYFENILPLGPDEAPADLHKSGLFENQLQAIRQLVEENHTLDDAKGWVQGVLDKLRGRN